MLGLYPLNASILLKFHLEWQRNEFRTMRRSSARNDQQVEASR
jgi:hypothetical protein